jgi:hypothetical protein
MPAWPLLGLVRAGQLQLGRLVLLAARPLALQSGQRQQLWLASLAA